MGLRLQSIGVGIPEPRRSRPPLLAEEARPLRAGVVLASIRTDTCSRCTCRRRPSLSRLGRAGCRGSSTSTAELSSKPLMPGYLASNSFVLRYAVPASSRLSIGPPSRRIVGYFFFASSRAPFTHSIELFYVLEGTFLIKVGDRVVTA